ncbi:hypothetical protein HYALB_00003687 [Hymenoscyphus albidus]|uniref:Uncharacterized protein n=1 Tax=Hymenoscyphus albidus TaxID=595503 RepID=A0A9N9LEU4_9HELO|nr:hypothetical protein HYALB_00003687 [Hymenoscyphus albidus]
MPTEPTTPVRVPKAVAAYAPTTQDPDLRSQINTVLLRDGHINKIQESLLHSLNSSSTNWPTLIHNHALHLLRAGDIVTFPVLMKRVLDDIRKDSVAARSAEGSNGLSTTGKGEVKGRGEGGANLALPKSVLDEGVKVTRECLEAVCEVGDA